MKLNNMSRPAGHRPVKTEAIRKAIERLGLKAEVHDIQRVVLKDSKLKVTRAFVYRVRAALVAGRPVINCPPVKRLVPQKGTDLRRIYDRLMREPGKEVRLRDLVGGDSQRERNAIMGLRHGYDLNIPRARRTTGRDGKPGLSFWKVVT